MVWKERAEIETIDENMPVLEDCDLDNSGAIEYVEAEIEPIDENMPGLEDCDLDNTIMPAVIFVSGIVFLEIEVVDADRGAVEYVARSLHKVMPHLRIIAFESRRTHT
jgi:hypothetical protein